MGVTLRYAFSCHGEFEMVWHGHRAPLDHESAFSRFLRLALIFPLDDCTGDRSTNLAPYHNPPRRYPAYTASWIGLGDFRWSADPDRALCGRL